MCEIFKSLKYQLLDEIISNMQFLPNLFMIQSFTGMPDIVSESEWTWGFLFLNADLFGGNAQSVKMIVDDWKGYSSF